jgi:purine-binding chemotaxis protein CheW
MENTETETVGQYLTFTMGDEAYAFPVTCVREVLVVPRVTRIPRMPDFMSGVINLRGAVVPILDLKLRFRLGETVIGISTAIIVVEIPSAKGDGVLHVGVYADSVNKVITLGSGDIEPAPSLGMRIKTEFILGMGHIGDSFTVILDAGKILSDEDVALAEAVRDGATE